jgi:hypothetical protein
METQQQPTFQPNESLDDAPHPPSLLESLAYRYAKSSIFPNDQGHTHLQSFVFQPIHKNLHGNPFGEPSLRHFVQLPPPHEPSQHFESLFSSYKKIEASQRSSIKTNEITTFHK